MLTTPHIVMTGWEYLIVRVCGYVSHGAMERNVTDDVGGFDFSLSNVKNTLSKQQQMKGDEEVFRTIVKYYLQGGEPQRGEFLGRLLSEIIFNQYCLRPSGDYEWSHFRSLHGRQEGPPTPPPPVTRGDQGYVIKSRWCRHLWNHPLSDLFQQGFYSTMVYVMGCKSLSTKSLGFSTRAVRVCKVNEWVEWGETWLGERLDEERIDDTIPTALAHDKHTLTSSAISFSAKPQSSTTLTYATRGFKLSWTTTTRSLTSSLPCLREHQPWTPTVNPA